MVAPPRVYLGMFVDNDAGRGVTVLSVRPGGPADRSGLHPKDLIVAAAGRKVALLSDLSTILSNLKPGDHLSLELVRRNRMLQVEVVLDAPPGTAQPGQPGTPPVTGQGAGPAEPIPPPPGDVGPPNVAPPNLGPPNLAAQSCAARAAPAPEGPAIEVPNPQPVPANSQQAQIDELRHKVEQLERRVQELEHALAESKRK